MSLSSLIPAGGDFCVLRADVVDTLLTCRDGDSALVYLYLVRKGQAFDEREALRDLHLTRDRYDRAVHTLTNLQLVRTPNEQPVQERSSVPPRYSVSEMRAQREDDHRFASVCQTAEIVLGRPLTDSQTRTLMNAYEYLGLPADVLIVISAAVCRPFLCQLSRIPLRYFQLNLPRRSYMRVLAMRTASV